MQSQIKAELLSTMALLLVETYFLTGAFFSFSQLLLIFRVTKLVIRLYYVCFVAGLFFETLPNCLSPQYFVFFAGFYVVWQAYDLLNKEDFFSDYNSLIHFMLLVLNLLASLEPCILQFHSCY